MTTMAPRGLPAGEARKAASLWPSDAVSSIILPMVRIPVVKKDAQTLVRLASTALKRAGANDGMAEAAARHLVHAEEHGLPTHGMSRVPFYCGMLRKGRADGAAQRAMVAERAGVCLIDNHDALPYVAAQWAIDEVIQRARRNGIAFA